MGVARGCAVSVVGVIVADPAITVAAVRFEAVGVGKMLAQADRPVDAG